MHQCTSVGIKHLESSIKLWPTLWIYSWCHKDDISVTNSYIFNPFHFIRQRVIDFQCYCGMKFPIMVINWKKSCHVGLSFCLAIVWSYLMKLSCDYSWAMFAYSGSKILFLIFYYLQVMRFQLALWLRQRQLWGGLVLVWWMNFHFRRT